MRTWVDKTDDDCALCQHLHRDDGACLGMIVHYLEDGATYGLVDVGARWTMTTDQAARIAVERALETGIRRSRRCEVSAWRNSLLAYAPP